MRNDTAAITKLCDRWWSHLSMSGAPAQEPRIHELLALLGWEQPLPFSPREASGQLDARPYLLRAAGRNLMICYAVPVGVLEPPSSIDGRCLDFSPATRMLVDEAHEAGVPYAWITDHYRSYLYDTEAEDLLLFADDPHAFAAHMAEVLYYQAAVDGVLEDLRRQPRSVQARRFREWQQRWIGEFSRRSMLPEHRATIIVDRLTTARFVFQHEILRRTRPKLEQRFLEVASRALEGETHGIGAALNRIFHDMWFDWRMEIFEPAPDIDDAVALDGLTAQLLQEFALLNESKFSAPVILESFNFGEPAEKLRVRMVPEYNEEREYYLSKQHLNTVDEARIEIDVNQEGYRAIACWFDRMVQLYREIEADFVARHGGHAEAAENEEEHDALFSWSDINHRRPAACADPFGYVCEHGLGIYCSTPHQYRIARLLLTLHLIESYNETGYAIERFPHFRNVLMKRPTPLPAQRLMEARRPSPAERWSEWP